MLEDAACELVEAVPPRPTAAEVLRAMAASGLTGGHAIDAHGGSLAVHTTLEAEEARFLRLRIARAESAHAYWPDHSTAPGSSQKVSDTHLAEPTVVGGRARYRGARGTA
ncbi:hypothetical protein BFF78_35675 [Streptomyces fodineus]|uniref:Uncharacterized protein n=1 Tax=Streptomyces fodineus TaxID=1904616 RepID=A0A1D7YJI8_9ACTN|nr:hypothetical protein BFF78_35675 [Streptomyces fodineus]